MHTNTFYLDTKQNGFTWFGRTLTRVMPLVYTKHVYSGRNRDCYFSIQSALYKYEINTTQQTLSSSNWSIHKHQVLCSLAVLDPRVGHTMDVLSPFIPVLCHSDWLFHGESCPCLDVVHPGRARRGLPRLRAPGRCVRRKSQQNAKRQKNQIV